MRESLEDHVIVVGFGRVGDAVLAGLAGLDAPFVVIERDASREMLARDRGIPTLLGDATDANTLRAAGIDRASALVAACGNDAENLVVVLTARSLNNDLQIVARVNESQWRDRMMQAGANVAQSPYDLYGTSLAAAAVSPVVLDIHSLPLLGLGTEEVQVPAGSPLVGATSEQIRRAHPLVQLIALRREGDVRLWHTIDDAIEAGDVLVVLGAPEYLAAMANAVTDGRASAAGTDSRPSHERGGGTTLNS